MGSLEPETSVAHEIGILGEILAPTQDKATSIAGFARVCTLHSAYPGQVATAGNLALPLTPLESPVGSGRNCCKLSVEICFTDIPSDSLQVQSLPSHGRGWRTSQPFPTYHL